MNNYTYIPRRPAYVPDDWSMIKLGLFLPSVLIGLPGAIIGLLLIW